LDNLAFLHRKIGRLRDAEKYWKKMYDLNPQNLLPIYNIGEMFFNQGINYLKQTPKYMITEAPNPYFEAAKPYLQKFHEKNPKNELIKEAYKVAKAGAKAPLKRNKKKEVVILPSPPTILVTEPGFETDTFYTENAAETIEGLLIDEDGGAEVVINGIVGTVENDRFSVLVPLRKGINEILIKGVNYDGLSAEKKLYIIRREKKQEINNYLLIFGTDTYEKQDSLLGHEAKLLYLDSVFNQSFENFGRLNTWRLIGKDAVKEKLVAAIRDISRNIKANDNLIFVFSGKTNDFSPNHETYLQTYTSEEKGNDLPASFVIELFKTVAARNQLFIFDCKLNKTFAEKAERSKFENVEFFTSRRIISEKKGSTSGGLLSGLQKLFEEDSMHAFYGYDLFFQLNLQQKNLCEYLYLLGDKAEGGDFLLKMRRK
jgi:tetratricopeptide (TPR) repeat protein